MNKPNFIRRTDTIGRMLLVSLAVTVLVAVMTLPASINSNAIVVFCRDITRYVTTTLGLLFVVSFLTDVYGNECSSGNADTIDRSLQVDRLPESAKTSRAFLTIDELIHLERSRDLRAKRKRSQRGQLLCQSTD